MCENPNCSGKSICSHMIACYKKGLVSKEILLKEPIITIERIEKNIVREKGAKRNKTGKKKEM
jgi:hypothetical protein